MIVIEDRSTRPPWVFGRRLQLRDPHRSAAAGRPATAAVLLRPRRRARPRLTTAPASRTTFVPAATPPPAGVQAFKDEFGFRYDGQGNRIDARGNIISPQSTRALEFGHGGSAMASVRVVAAISAAFASPPVTSPPA